LAGHDWLDVNSGFGELGSIHCCCGTGLARIVGIGDHVGLLWFGIFASTMSGDLNGDGEFDFKLLLDHANRGGRFHYRVT
jgi:hypothetical protein